MIAAFSHFKLGLLTLVTLVALVIAALVLGVRKHPEDTYHTYFDESVQGLDVGAPVKFRGVRIGRVVAIDLAPDRRHVDVQLAIDRKSSRSLALATEPGMRTEVAAMGVTGVKLVEIDIVDPTVAPPPTLPFPPATPYIASRPSFLVDLQRGITVLRQRLPALTDRATKSFDKLDQAFDGVGKLVESAHRTVEDVDHVVRSVAREQLPARLASALRGFTTSATKLDALVDKIRTDGDGLIASARRTTESLGDLGRETRESTIDLGETLREIREAARSVREFVDALENEPDMLVKGRSRREQR
jgi:ABC-type transporter Mla subunit MlaD